MVLATAGLAAACATAPPESTGVRLPPNAGVYKIGNPYQIDGTWYYPHEQPDYDETGIASWYGPDFYGHRTADGEMYDGSEFTAAHRTLPMPVNVRVTNLQNGKSIVVRVNDRGPYAKGRIIDLSAAAAKALDMIRTGTAPVRVTYLGRADGAAGAIVVAQTPPQIANALPADPTEKIDSAALSVVPGAAVDPPVRVASLPTPSPLMSAPLQASDDQVTGQVEKVPVPAVTHIYIQVGAFSNETNALRLKSQFAAADALDISPIIRGGKTLYRVRSGPYNNVADADAALAKLTDLGNNNAQIVVDR